MNMESTGPRNQKYERAILVKDGIHWVGFYDELAHLHCNPYILTDGNEAVFFDPGSLPDFPQIMRKVIEVSDPLDIAYIVVSHQDPDVCGNLAVVEDVIDRSDMKIVGHMNTIRLIQHYGVRSKFYPVEQNEYRLNLRSGRQIEFIFTPFLHSPGAIVAYDAATKSLFTGDIFGAISDHWALFAEDDYLTPMAAFHQAYMPSNQVLKAGLERLERYEIDQILPQHGSILRGDQIPKAFEYLKSLPCGVDLEGSQ